jgi:hypothetical protein
MAATTYGNETITLARVRGVDWGAIWAGVFTFIGIWSVFGLLGAAIFASSANPNAARPITGMSWGMSIWAIVLTIIAMYVGSLETGRLAAVTSRREGVTHGMAMFGLSVVAALVLIVLGGNSINGPANLSTHSPYVLTVVSGLGWAGFLSLFLGWLAAMGGASAGIRRNAQAETPVQPIRKAA